MLHLASSVLRQLRAAAPGVAVAVLGCILLCFALLKLYSLNFVKGDEHMYFYMSLLVSKGEWPYRDFFFSHPPLQLYLMGALYKLFGYSLALSKAVPSLAAMVSGVHVYLLGRRLVGRIEALIAVALFLFTFDVLRGSSHFTGANCALAFGLAATYQALARRPILAGVLFAVGTFIGVYIAPLALMLGVLLAFRSWKESLRLLCSYAAASVLICAVFVGVAGHAFWYQVFGYNLNKVALRYSWYAKARNVAYLNTAATIGFVPGIVWAVAMWALRGRARGEPALPGAAGRLGAWLNLWGGDRVAAQTIFATFICGYLYFYSTRVDYYSYYFMLIMPWMGLMTATVTVDVFRFVGERLGSAAPGEPPLSCAERRRRQEASRKQRRRAGSAPNAPRPAWRVWPLVVCAVSLALVLVYRRGIGADRQEEAGEDVMTYTWRDSPFLPGAANRIVRALFWSPASDSTHPPNAIAYYLQHETQSAPTVDAFVRAVRSECRPGERIFGEYSLGPFAAAVGSCVLGANLADTNPHRFKVHESTPEDWVRALEQDHLDIAIVVPGSSILKERAMRDYLTGTFPRLVATWDDPYVGHVELHRRAQ
jgi:4-amino-4-deoxy-L-arabinose transferase-like glycosyltransferase